MMKISLLKGIVIVITIALLSNCRMNSNARATMEFNLIKIDSIRQKESLTQLVFLNKSLYAVSNSNPQFISCSISELTNPDSIKFEFKRSNISKAVVSGEQQMIFRLSVYEKPHRRAKLLFLDVNQRKFDTIPTPLQSVGNFFFIGSKLFVEGYEKGSNSIYYSDIHEYKWEKLDLIDYGYRSMHIVGQIGVSNDIIAKVSKLNSHRSKSYLVVLDHTSFKEKYSMIINDSRFINVDNYNSTFGILNGDHLSIYNFKPGSKFERQRVIDLSRLDGNLVECYYKGDIAAVSMSTGRPSIVNTYVSNNFGASWNMVGNNQLKIVINNSSELTLVDPLNNIYSLEITE